MTDFERLLGTVERAVAGAIADCPRVAVAYSGGLDSTIVAFLARRYADVKCYTACTTDSYDSRNISIMAAEEEFDVEVIELTKELITDLVIRAGRLLETDNLVSIGYAIPLLAAIEAAEEDVILAGNGADELFAGYAKYESASDVSKLMKLDLKKALFELDRFCVYANNAHKRLAAPFASTEVIEVASAISVRDELGRGGKKLVLREVAKELGIHGWKRAKKAAQYSSGATKAMGRIAKEQGLSTGAWTEALLTSESAQSSNR
ncbi:MAG: hypothetical protein JSV94_06205 [Methanobacteriota archaeon]|nr:MAG: hypothetical protein JSV94_06205 [Euryarchaeota archaeon]